MSGPVVKLRDVRKTYPGVTALAGVDLDVDAGELMAIVGPSGSGKSTLLHVVGTLDRAGDGVVHIDGHDVAELDDRELAGLRAARIGFVFQQFFLLETLTALDNVAQGLLYQAVPLAKRRARAAEMLGRVGLGARMDHRPTQLSGGERQRVAIARALVADPALVLADEPTGNLDSASGAAVVALLRDLNADGTTILVITHDHELARSLPRQVALRDGLVEHDTALGPRVVA
jgi:putative ABC transport system ATP-binding protein